MRWSGSYLKIENRQRGRVFGEEQGEAEAAILEEALLLGDNAAPRQENLPPRGLAHRSAGAALCREEIGPPGIPLSRPAWRWQLLCANNAHFEF